MPNIEKSPNVLSLDELAEIGAHVVNLCGPFPALGHVSPVGSIVDYCAASLDQRATADVR